MIVRLNARIANQREELAHKEFVITALRKERDELREALEPFTRGPDKTSLARLYAHLTREHYHKARAALGERTG